MNPLRKLCASLLNPKSDLRALLPGPGSDADDPKSGEAPAGMRTGINFCLVLTNIPLLVGILIVLGLFLLVLFGPLWAPMNPYIAGEHIAPHYDFELEEFIRPPLAPSDEFPLGTDQWGSDLLSMLLHGARNTLIACAFITMVRVILGVFFGALAGWNEGKTIDHFVMGMIGVLNAVPMLISSMLLIYALDIRRGLPVFIVALSASGWTEIAQYIRSEFLVLRKKPFIEGAYSIGLTGMETAVRHILPNLVPQLIVITFLEMGAVMMLLGELGFVGVYIGGGSRISIEVDAMRNQIYSLADVPEWGAMLAEGFRYLRTKPFVVLPPAMAFFIAVFGFNTLGEGLRQLFEHSSINTSFLLKKRMLLVVAGLTAATMLIISRTGPAPWFDRVAQAFDGERAYTHAQALSAMEGRGVGQAGGEQAAEYIQTQLEGYGMDPGWRQGSYVFPLEAVVVRPVTQPVLALLDSEGKMLEAFSHQIDFGYVLAEHGGSGSAMAPITLIGFPSGTEELPPEAYRGLDLTGRVVLLQEGVAPESFPTEALLRGAVGVIWMIRGETHASLSQTALVDEGGFYLLQPSIPIFRLRQAAAESMLNAAGFSGDEAAWQDAAEYSGEGWYGIDLNIQAEMQLQLGEQETINIPNVLAYSRGSDFDLADELVILFVAYDGLGIDPDGTVYPGANHNASSIGVLLEIARLWQEQNLDTRRPALFIAWGGGSLGMDAARSFLSDNFNFRHLPTDNMTQIVHPVMVFYLDNAGAGGDRVEVYPSSSVRLIGLLEETAAEQEISLVVAESTVGFSESVGRELPFLHFQWENPWTDPGADGLERLDVERLQSLGEAFSLALTRIFRQADY
ncbi:MAG: ABC transporter permease subunit [Anaerolineales bacterium]|nr:ABC transporter permease subunit [Anaerolineales bacterium]